MSAASEAALTSLMSHMHEVETRRRLVMIRLKDGETRAAHAVEELAVEKKSLEQLTQREESLKHQLRLLSDEHELSAARHNAAFATLRQVEMEEPLLAQHAKSNLDANKKLAASWQHNLEKIREISSSWSSDSLIAPLRRQLDAQRAELDSLTQEESRLLQEAAQLNSAASLPTSPSALHSVQQNAALAEASPAEIARLERELAEVTAAAEERAAADARQRQSWEKEIGNLHSRIAELQQWITGTESQAAAIASDTVVLRQLISQGVCRACS